MNCLHSNGDDLTPKWIYKWATEGSNVDLQVVNLQTTLVSQSEMCRL